MLIVSREDYFRAISELNEEEEIQDVSFDFERFRQEYKETMAKFDVEDMFEDISDEIYRIMPYLNELHEQKVISLVGDGSSRIAFLMKNGQCLKVAKSEAGKAQNRQEVKTLSNQIKFGCFPSIHKWDTQDFTCLLTDFCAETEYEDWEEALDGGGLKAVVKCLRIYSNSQYDWEQVKTAFRKDLSDAMEDVNCENPEPYARYALTRAQNNWKGLMAILGEDRFHVKESIQEIAKFWKKYGTDALLPGDLDREANWGRMKKDGTERFVIIDAGFSESVRKLFY